jgi:prepilin peptidase CpaA
MWSTALHDSGIVPLQWGAVLGTSLVAAFWDARTRRIPNALTGVLLLGGLLHAGLVAGAAGLADSVVACLLLATPYVVLFALAGGGAGDAKLMGAIGAWLGLLDGTRVLVGVCLAGVLLGLLWAAAHRRLPAVLGRLKLVTTGLLHLPFRRISARAVAAAIPAEHEGLPMPYGPAIFAGCALALGASVPW